MALVIRPWLRFLSATAPGKPAPVKPGGYRVAWIRLAVAGAPDIIRAVLLTSTGGF